MSKILPFSSRGLAGQRGPRRLERAAPQRHRVEIVRLDRTVRDEEDALKRVRTGAPPARFPVVPNLPNSPDSGSRCIKGQSLPQSPCSESMNGDPLRHIEGSKRYAYSLTSRGKRFNGSFVSADILQFARMEDAPNRIRELRSAQGLSQQAVGDMIGVSKMTVSDLERGRMELTVEYMRRIARALAVRPSDLLHTEDNPDRLSDEERELLYRFRAAAPSQRELIKRIAEPVGGDADDRRVA